jgi:hypothetical protein
VQIRPNFESRMDKHGGVYGQVWTQEVLGLKSQLQKNGARDMSSPTIVDMIQTSRD